MSELAKRKHIKVLLEGKKHTVKEISLIVGVSTRTVYNIISKLAGEITLEQKPGCSRPPKLLQKIKKYVVKSVSVNPATSIRILTKKCPINVSRDTVSRCLHQLDYSKPYPTKIPMLSEKNRLYRIEWAKSNITNDWQHAIFADEAAIWLSKGTVRKCSKKGTIPTRPTFKHTSKIHIWSAFSSVGTFPLCILQTFLQPLCSLRYWKSIYLQKSMYFIKISGFL